MEAQIAHVLWILLIGNVLVLTSRLVVQALGFVAFWFFKHKRRR